VEIGTKARRKRKLLTIQTYKIKADVMQLMTLKIEKLQKMIKNMEKKHDDDLKKMEGLMKESIKRTKPNINHFKHEYRA
jgi:hypothetical protein